MWKPSGIMNVANSFISRPIKIAGIGSTLKEIGGVLNLLDGKEMNCTHAAKMINLKLSEIDQKIEALHRVKRLLKKLTNSIGKCDTKGGIDILSEFLSQD